MNFREYLSESDKAYFRQRNKRQAEYNKIKKELDKLEKERLNSETSAERQADIQDEILVLQKTKTYKSLFDV